MNSHAQQFSVLAAGWLEGQLSDQETAELLEICRSSPDRLAELASLTEVDRLLPLLDKTQSTVFADEIRRRLERQTTNDNFAIAVATRIRRRRHLQLASSLAAVAAAIILAILFTKPRTGPSGAPKPTDPIAAATVATLGHSIAAQWETGYAPADGVFTRKTYRLAAGLVQLQFDSGVHMIVEAPADFSILDDQHVIVRDGTITARVPDGAEGFTVDSTTTRVIDRGTEFAVSTRRTGETEVHVLEGIVDAEPIGRVHDRVRLTVNEAKAFNPGGTTSDTMPATPDRFYRELPETIDALPNYLYWSFDEGHGVTATASNHGLAPHDVVARFATIDPDRPGPTWVPGPSGTAIELDGHDDYLQTDYSGIGGPTARTVAFWVRIPTDWTPQNGYGIVSWGSYDYHGATWQVSCNPIAKEGPLGRLRVGINRGQVIGQTDLRDDRWHHVAVVMYGGADANTATHIILFLDGRLEPAATKSVLPINTDIEGANARSVLIGRSATLSTTSYRSFRGAVDEMYLFDGALSQYQIQQLMQGGD